MAIQMVCADVPGHPMLKPLVDIRARIYDMAHERATDETVGEMWSLYDGQDVLNEVDPRFSQNIKRHIQKVIDGDPFHVSANTDPKGDRSKPPQEQDPDVLLHVVKETDAGISPGAVAG